MEKDQRARIIFLIVLSAITGWFCYLIAKPFIKPIITALVFAIVFFPVHAELQRKIRNRNLSALLSTFFVLLVIILPTVMLGVAIRKELTAFYQALGTQNGGWISYLLQATDRVKEWVGGYVDVSQFDLRTELVNRARQMSSFLLSRVAGTVTDVVTFIIDGVIAFFTLFFLFRDGRSAYRRLTVITPLRPSQIEELTSEMSKTIIASMYGGLAVAAAQGLLTSLAFWVLGLPSPLLWGVAAGLFSFVPFVGSSLVWLPASIILFFTGHWVKGLLLLVWGAGVVGMADNVIRPYVISGQVRFHPLYIFFALLGGVQAFGILGLFIGPVVLAIAQSLFKIVREEIRELKTEYQEVEQH